MSTYISRYTSNGSAWAEVNNQAATGSAWGTPSPLTGGISFIGSNSAGSSFAATLNVSKLNAALAGDVSYVFGAARNSRTMTAPAGWTTVGSQLAGSNYIFLWRKVLTGSEPSNYTFTISSANTPWVLSQTVLRGVDNTTPEQNTIALAGGWLTTSFSVGPLTPTVANSYVLFGIAMDNASTTTTVFDQTMTLQGNYIPSAGSLLSVAYQQLPLANVSVALGAQTSGGVSEGCALAVVVNAV
jgi:hypothetical protein